MKNGEWREKKEKIVLFTLQWKINQILQGQCQDTFDAKVVAVVAVICPTNQLEMNPRGKDRNTKFINDNHNNNNWIGVHVTIYIHGQYNIRYLCIFSTWRFKVLTVVSVPQSV